MARKRILILLLVILLLPLALITVARAESRLVWSFDWEGFDVEVYAPYQAYAGDTITIGVRTEAKKDLRDVYVEIRLCGSKLDGYDAWTDNISVLSGERLYIGAILDQNFNVSIPSDVSPGLIYGHTYCKWKVGKTYFYIPRELDDSFTVTYLKNKAYEDLQVAYSDLLNDYDALLANYSDLLDYYNSLSDDYVSLNSTYYDLLGTYDQLQSDYNSLQESFDTLNSDYGSLNFTYHDLLSMYNQLQSDHESLQENSDTLNSNYVSLNSTYYNLLGTYDQLQSDYNSLQESSDILDNNYNNLQINYDSLHAKWEDLKSKNEDSKANLSTTWNLSYILMITTIIFMATTAYLAIRKPKVKPKLETT